MVLSPLCGWVLQGSFGSFFFSVSKVGNAVETGNYDFLLSLYISEIIPGLSVVLSPFSGWVCTGLLGFAAFII